MKDKIIVHLMRYLPRHIATLLADEILALFERERVDYAGMDAVKWGEVDFISRKMVWDDSLGYPEALYEDDRHFEDDEGIVDTEIIKMNCPEELKEAYKAIRDVREALLKLERNLRGEK